MSNNCTINGNSDLYGLGIRLGIYLQWLSAPLAVAVGFYEAAISVLEAYTIFSLAIIIALFSLTFTSTPTHEISAIDIVIMLFLVFGGLLGAVMCPYLEAPTARRKWRQNALAVVWAIASGYSAWFWLAGQSSTDLLEMPCSMSVFLFAKIDDHHQIKVVSRFFAGLSIIYGVSLSLGVIPLPISGALAQAYMAYYVRREAKSAVKNYDLIVQYVNEKIPLPKPLPMSMSKSGTTQSTTLDVSAETSQAMEIYLGLLKKLYRVPTLDQQQLQQNELQSHLPQKSPGRIYVTLIELVQFGVDSIPVLGMSRLNSKETFINLQSLSAIYTVIGIELMLHWNHVSGVYTIRSVGQLIPFVIGLAGFLKLLLDAKHEHKKELREIKKRLETSDSDPGGGLNDLASSSDTYACMQRPDGRWG